MKDIKVSIVLAALLAICLTAPPVSGQGIDVPFDLAVDELGNIYVTGASMNGDGNVVITTIIYGPTGTPQLTRTIPGHRSGAGIPAAIAVMDSTIIVTGTSPDAATGHDIVTVAYDRASVVSVSRMKALPSSLVLKQSYPNPVSPGVQATIIFGLPHKGRVQLRVIDVMGREVATLVDEYKEAGTYRIMFNPSSLSAGTYFYVLTSSSSSEVRKLRVVK